MVLLWLTLASACLASTLPVVDLGYERHQALSYNSSSGLYSFDNIRYAAPPVGDLRFRAPTAPKVNRQRIQNGSVARMCPQAAPLWSTKVQTTFALDYLSGQPFNMSTDISSYTYTPTKQDPAVSEDCLFLDVTVPKKVFDRTKVKSGRKNLAPVMVWIYGGGYIAGDKTSNDARGLVHRGTVAGHEGIVYVALNYRLGAFGWLGGESVNANGTANAALHDQRFALEWVHKNIHLFGGDPSRITVMGESAGGGSIMHQITAYGGKQSPPRFQQAIIQSPGWVPVIGEEQQEDTLQQFLGFLNVSTIEEARTLSSDKVIAANSAQIAVNPKWGTFTYGPAVDGTFVPAMPGQLLLEGNFHHDVNVMVGHAADEGLLFTTPESYNSTGFGTQLSNYAPSILKDVFEFVEHILYPPIYNGTFGYTDSVARAALFVSDLGFQCNTDYLNRAFNQTYAYAFNIIPGLHGQDAAYTFYNEGSTEVSSTSTNPLLTVSNVTVALAMQDYFLSFTEHGVPTSSLGPTIEPWGPHAQLMSLETEQIRSIPDKTRNARCSFWQPVPYASG
ncbi:unnamed protein product [Penicillium salamii]|nr:unnamed protein product [Penicillium salamii]CAG8203860.1 unnamed protein product [Penicillium salamii]CAG8395214.1 unnamed protein product [Penicillium salamii]